VWIKDRWWGHLCDLRKNKHKNIKLQVHFNKYGEQDLQFTVLEGCTKELLIQREQYYIDTLNPWFNICMVANSSLGVKRSKQTKEKYSRAKIGHIPWNKGKNMSIEHCMKLSNSHRGFRLWARKPILQYTLDGVFIKEWDSAATVTLELCINNSNIHSCLTGNRTNAGGFIWKHKNTEL